MTEPVTTAGTVLSFDPNGAAFADLPTPALVLDREALARNLERMNSFLAAQGQHARPHTKTHKSPEIAALQVAMSQTVGVCCARVAELEALVESGIRDVLVTSPMTTREKVRRFVACLPEAPSEAPGSGVCTVVDSGLGVELLAAELQRSGKQAAVIIDLDPGFHRTGIDFGEPALGLARLIADHPQLHLHGLQMYAGTLMHLESAAERFEKATALWQRAKETAELLEANGHACPVLTGGGTGTFDLDASIGIATDLQVGSYVFMDAQYRAIENSPAGTAGPFDFFEPALFVIAAAVSQPAPGLITVDAGFKALSCDHAPEVPAHPAVNYHFAGDEHGILQLGAASRDIALGDRVALLVSHCDPTVNLHQSYHLVRNGRLDGTWPIAARGFG